MAKYLVTGGFGFVGSHLVEKLHTRGDEVTIVDNLSNGYLRNLQHIRNSVIPYLANVENLKSVSLTDRFDGIFHLATAPRSSSLIDPFTDIETNCKGMIAVLEVARSHDAKVVFTSNSGIYGQKTKAIRLINITLIILPHLTILISWRPNITAKSITNYTACAVR